MVSDDILKQIVARLADDARDALEEYNDNPGDAFIDGKMLTYYCVLDVIKNILTVNDIDLNNYFNGFNVDILINGSQKNG